MLVRIMPTDDSQLRAVELADFYTPVQVVRAGLSRFIYDLRGRPTLEMAIQYEWTKHYDEDVTVTIERTAMTCVCVVADIPYLNRQFGAATFEQHALMPAKVEQQ